MFITPDIFECLLLQIFFQMCIAFIFKCILLHILFSNVYYWTFYFQMFIIPPFIFKYLLLHLLFSNVYNYTLCFQMCIELFIFKCLLLRLLFSNVYYCNFFPNVYYYTLYFQMFIIASFIFNCLLHLLFSYVYHCAFNFQIFINTPVIFKYFLLRLLFSKVKVVLRICPVDVNRTNSFLSIDESKKVVTVYDPANSGYVLPSHRRNGLTAPKMFGFDAVFSQDDSLVSFSWQCCGFFIAL